MSLILKDWHLWVDGHALLHDIHLQVEGGERLALIGHNGAGKTSLFKALSGEWHWDEQARQLREAGEMSFNGQSLRGLWPHQRQAMGLSRAFQTAHLWGALTAEQHLQMALLAAREHVGGQARRFSAWRPLHLQAQIRQQTQQWLVRAQLCDMAHMPAAQLSYGLQRQLELAMTFANSCEGGLVMLDEPTAGLSERETAALIPLIHAWSAGRTLLMVEHDLSVVRALADRVVVMREGTLICDEGLQR